MINNIEINQSDINTYQINERNAASYLVLHNIIMRLKFIIYRNPTATNIIIPNDSSHPPEHKHVAINFTLNQMETYILDDINKKAELDTIEQILTNNVYVFSIIKQIKKTRTKFQLKHK